MQGPVILERMICSKRRTKSTCLVIPFIVVHISILDFVTEGKREFVPGVIFLSL